MSRATQPRVARRARLSLGKGRLSIGKTHAIGRKGLAVFSVSAFALLALASSASAASSTLEATANVHSGIPPQPATVSLNLGVGTNGEGFPVGETEKLTQTFSPEFASNLASFAGCAESNYNDNSTGPGGAKDPSVSCPANSIVGTGFFESKVSAGFTVTSNKVVIVKDSTTGGLAFWTTFEIGGVHSGIIPGTVSTNEAGETVITWNPKVVEPEGPFLVYLSKFKTVYNDNQESLQSLELFSNTGCESNSWPFSVKTNYTGGANETANASVACEPVPPVAPENTSVPTIAGVTQVGEQLTESDGTWTAYPAPSFSRQWFDCDSEGNNCTEISGATGTTYTLQPSDVGSTIEVVVTAKNTAAPEGITASSAPTAVVTNFTQTNGNGPVTVEGTVPLTEALSLSSTTLNLGTLIPGAELIGPPISGALYQTSTVATVTSSTTTAQLTIKDPDATHPGQLQQGSYYLPTPIFANAMGSGTGATYSSTPSPVGSSTAPTTLVNYGAPIANDSATIGFGQLIGATTPLHTGTYSKTFTVTLAETSP